LIEIQVSINGLQISNLLNSSIEFFPDIMMVVSSAKRILLNGIVLMKIINFITI
jgi:hypothetical protein